MGRWFRVLTAAIGAALAATTLWAGTKATTDAQAPAAKTLTIFAAASLTDVLPQVAAAWKKAGGGDVTFNFDASSRLAKQISLGAPADLFFSADEEWMDFLSKPARLAPGTRASLLENDLVVIVPASSATNAFDPAGLRKLALAGEHVPAGKYAQAALQFEKVWPLVDKKIVRGDNVRTVLTWVTSGNVDAGVVYGTDARAAQGKARIVHTFAPGSHPRISYPAAVLVNSPKKDEALAFLTFCRSSEASAVFNSAGFRTQQPSGPKAP